MALILLPALRAHAAVQVWCEDPWTFTAGGTIKPSKAALAAPWKIRMLRNGTEQVIIGLMNTGRAPVDVKVSASSTLPEKTSQVDLLALGGIKSRSQGDVLVNLFTEAQVKSFQDKFPATFTNTDQIRDFPLLHLPPQTPVRVWLRVRTFPGVDATEFPPAGDYQIHFTAEGGGEKAEKAVSVTVLPAVMPSEPLIETQTYGGADPADDKLHHTTVNLGYRRYVFSNMLVFAHLWGKPMAEMAQKDPQGFQKQIEDGTRGYVETLEKTGLRQDQILVEIYDEPSDNPAMQANWFAVAKVIKRTMPSVKIIANPQADWSGQKVSLDGTFKPLNPYVDVWMPYIAHYSDPDTFRFLKSTGKPLWAYCNCALAEARNEHALSNGYIRTAGWLAVKYRLDGMAFWAAAAYVGDPWNDFDKSPAGVDWPDAAVVFHSTAGAIDTRGWEAWREAIEEVNIYRMIERAVSAGSVPADKLAQAQTWLRTAPDRALKVKQDDPRVLRQVLDEGLDILASAKS